MPVVFANPPISVAAAHCFVAFFAVLYVGSLYLSRSGRLSFKKVTAPDSQNGEERRKERDERWRNDPSVIRARMLAASLSTLVSCMLVTNVIWNLVGKGYPSFGIALESTLVRLGFTLNFDYYSALRILLPCLVTPVLFLGPLYVEFLASSLPFQKHWSIARCLRPMFTTWQGWRNYIIGPFTEEVVFRSCVITLYHLAGASHSRMIFLSPLVFGVAHLHHAWDVFNRYGRNVSAAKRAIFTCVFQLAYTTLFGAHCVFLLLRSGSILPPLTSHIFCNIMDVPRYSVHVAHFPQRRTAIKLAYFLGILGYVYTLTAWTLAKDSLYWPRAGVRPKY